MFFPKHRKVTFQLSWELFKHSVLGVAAHSGEVRYNKVRYNKERGSDWQGERARFFELICYKREKEKIIKRYYVFI